MREPNTALLRLIKYRIHLLHWPTCCVKGKDQHKVPVLLSVIGVLLHLAVSTQAHKGNGLAELDQAKLNHLLWL